MNDQQSSTGEMIQLIGKQALTIDWQQARIAQLEFELASRSGAPRSVIDKAFENQHEFDRLSSG